MHTLYLRACEQELCEKLPPALCKECAMVEEELASYEHPRELVVRMRLVASDAHPEVRELVLSIQDALQRGRDIDPAVLNVVPHESLPIVYFGMGALGLSALIEVMLSQVKTPQDIAGIAGLTKIRHILLEANASVTP